MSQQKELIENNIGKIEGISLVEEMESSYLTYAMSVILSRALPDVRDGLKPVHRRILVTLRDLHLYPGGRFRKSAKICGDVSGNYHPHGEAIIYPSMVRLAQDFAYRYTLVKGQGNFGSIDGDPPAQMRYTEAKMTHYTEEILKDLEKNTVNWKPNYDGTLQEPEVLPAKFPNLIVNGTIGIAVGMATNIPPHNLSEICDGITHLVDNPEATVEDLMDFVKGPDFPTRGIIYDKKDLLTAYATGKGGFVVRGVAEIVEAKVGYNIIITEIPYQVNKTTLIEKIAFLVKEKKIDGIRGLRDESDKDASIRIVIELKKDAFPKKILNQLYKMTQLQEKFHINSLALVDGVQPRVLSLKMILEEYIKHRRIVITKRTQYELDKAKDRAHILEGLVLALENIDKIIATIKKSKDKESAKQNLIKSFKLSERQSIAILEMKLQQLANLERIRLEKELEDKRKLIEELESILQSEQRILDIIKSDLLELKEKYGDNRKTKVVPHAVDEFSMEDLVPNEQSLIVMTESGYIKRLAHDSFKSQGRGGKGVIGLTTKETDTVSQVFSSMTHDDLLFFTTKGRVFQLKAYEIPQSLSRTAKGQALVNFLQLAPNETVSKILSMSHLKNYKYLVMVTTHGVIKKVDIEDFTKVRKSGLIAISLKEDDTLEWVTPSTGKDEIVLVSSLGQSIRFKESDVRAMGRVAAGVKGIKLKGDAVIVGMGIVDNKKENPQLLVVMANGFGKRSDLGLYKVQKRSGSGIRTAKITSKTGEIVSAMLIYKGDDVNDLLVMSKKGQVIRLSIKAVNKLGRDTQGIRLMRFKMKNDTVASVTFLEKEEAKKEKPQSGLNL